MDTKLQPHLDQSPDHPVPDTTTKYGFKTREVKHKKYNYKTPFSCTALKYRANFETQRILAELGLTEVNHFGTTNQYGDIFC